MTQPKKYLNHLELKQQIFGNEERYKLLKDAMENSTLFPKTVDYEDIDSSFKEWVEKKLKISFNSKILPTMVLYSNQRFTEYSQTWEYTDENKNLILNFKTVTRENDPQYGQIQGGLWNIPGNRFYLMKKQIVLDNNGSESIQALKMRQPMAVDFNYTVSIYTTNIETINKFNRIVNNRFKARQDYISPNGYYMPMTLENISDKSSYQIDDRQFYSQSFEIKLMGYVLTEDDFRVEEQPLKIGVGFENMLSKKKANIEVYENVTDKSGYTKEIVFTIDFPPNSKSVVFDSDSNFLVSDVSIKNIRDNYKVYVNGTETYIFCEDEDGNPIDAFIKNGDEIRIKISQIRQNEKSVFKITGLSNDEFFEEKAIEDENVDEN